MHLPQGHDLRSGASQGYCAPEAVNTLAIRNLAHSRFARRQHYHFGSPQIQPVGFQRSEDSIFLAGSSVVCTREREAAAQHRILPLHGGEPWSSGIHKMQDTRKLGGSRLDSIGQEKTMRGDVENPRPGELLHCFFGGGISVEKRGLWHQTLQLPRLVGRSG